MPETMPVFPPLHSVLPQRSAEHTAAQTAPADPPLGEVGRRLQLLVGGRLAGGLQLLVGPRARRPLAQRLRWRRLGRGLTQSTAGTPTTAMANAAGAAHRACASPSIIALLILESLASLGRPPRRHFGRRSPLRLGVCGLQHGVPHLGTSPFRLYAGFGPICVDASASDHRTCAAALVDNVACVSLSRLWQARPGR